MINADLLKNKNILLRADLDVPIKEGKVANNFRLQTLIPTLKLCLENAKSTLIIGHLGRPEGVDGSLSLTPVREWLESAMNQSIYMITSGYSPGEWAREQFPLAMFDNIRFDKRELEINRGFAEELTQGSDIYIYEAFAAYNSATSLQKIPEILPTYTGIQFDQEVENLTHIVKSSDTPRILIISGAKDDKLPMIDKLSGIFDEVLVGGKLASLVRPKPKVIPATLTPDGLDVDESSSRLFSDKIKSAKSVVVNGPLGKFEDGIHAAATKAIFQVIKDSPCFSLVGGGDTLAAIPLLGFDYSDFDFVSTGGGAMLEFLATGTHPLLEIIKRRAA